VLASLNFTPINNLKIINWLSSLPGSLYKDSNKITFVFFEVSTIFYIFYNLALFSGNYLTILEKEKKNWKTPPG
jgi:hypothetical protein